MWQMKTEGNLMMNATSTSSTRQQMEYFQSSLFTDNKEVLSSSSNSQIGFLQTYNKYNLREPSGSKQNSQRARHGVNYKMGQTFKTKSHQTAVAPFLVHENK